MGWSILLGTGLIGLAMGAAQAAELKVLTAGAFKPVVSAMAPDFERQTGHKLIIDNDTAGALTRRIEGGEPFDIVFLPPAAVATLTQSNRVTAQPQAPVARVAIGVAVKDGAAAPDIATSEAFRSALLNARRIAVIDPKAGGSSGIYLAELFKKWSIDTVLQPKLVLVPGGLVAQRVVNDEADLAIHQISEILAVPGARLVGPLPTEIQNYTVYAGALSQISQNRDAGAALLAFMKGREAHAVMREKGMEPTP